MSKLGALPKKHPALEPVNPEHLAYAFSVANGVLAHRMETPDPSTKTCQLEIEDGDVKDYTFTDNPFARLTFTLQRELRAFSPKDDPESFLKATAIQFRVVAIPRMLSKDGHPELIDRDSNGDYFLGPKAILAFASAPLSRRRGEFKQKDFAKHLKSISISPEQETLKVPIPSEFIKNDPEETRETQ